MTEATLQVDVLVAGLGPAGASAAAAAAKAGCSVLAVDRKSQAGEPVQCAEFVPGMIGLEVADVAVAHEQAIDSMTTFVEDEAPETVANFPGHMINRKAFDRHLCLIAEGEGAQCVFGVRVKVLSKDGVCTLSNGDVVLAKVVIGCDGPKSKVGKAVGQINDKLVETRQITVPLNQTHSATDIFLSADIPGGYAWLFPKGQVANLGVGVRPGDKARLKSLLEQLHEKLVLQNRVGNEVFFHTGGPIPVGGMLKAVNRLGERIVLLAGDAAGLTNPVTGAGINSAVLSGRSAGQCAAAWARGRRDAAHEYEEELEDLFAPALARALKRRQEVLEHFETDLPRPHELRRGWIAYPEYWAA